MSMPTRIDNDLFDAAKSTGELQSRSAAQQITHWARIGREFEASGNVSHRAVAQVLSGRESYDGLNDREQAVVRAEWDAEISARLAELNLAAEFSAAGESWSEADKSGQVIRKP